MTEPAALRPRRTKVLDLLRGDAVTLSARQVADLAGIHLNTARFHLDALVDSGHAERSVEDRIEPGRPSVLYRATDRTGGGSRNYDLLAQMLTGLVTSLDVTVAQARGAGREWGRHLVDRPLPSEVLDTRAALGRLEAMLDRVGFQPEIVQPEIVQDGGEAGGEAGGQQEIVQDGREAGGEQDDRETAGAQPDRPTVDRGETDVRLHHCPFRELAESHADLICGIHLGLIEGALGEVRSPVAVRELRAFVTPHLCVARLG